MIMRWSFKIISIRFLYRKKRGYDMSLTIKNLSKQYGEKVVVDDISFEIKEPGVYALLGTNGAGKTTTLRIILGMLAHDGGEVLWEGKPLDTVRTNVGYLAEERGLYPKYSLLDQLLYFAKLKNVPKKLAMQRIKDWSEKLQVNEYVFPVKKGKKSAKANRADQLSKGNQQKIQVIASLLHNHPLGHFSVPPYLLGSLADYLPTPFLNRNRSAL